MSDGAFSSFPVDISPRRTGGTAWLLVYGMIRLTGEVVRISTGFRVVLMPRRILNLILKG